MTAPAKVDLKKELANLYNPSPREVVLVDVPPLIFLMMSGAGNPNTSQEYAEAVEALYNVAYTLKFKLKRSGGPDYGVMPLEGLWWADDMTDFTAANKDHWKWTMMIRQPKEVTRELYAQVLDEVKQKKGLPVLNKMRLEQFHEGPSAQIMHIGPYSAEEPTIAKLHAFIEEQGYKRRGKHHEIYLGDPRRTAPEKLRTVIRQPVE
jgi:hypothetical protein